MNRGAAMIVESIVSALVNLFLNLTSGIDIPDMPEAVSSAVEMFGTYLASGLSILDGYVNMSVVTVLFGIVVVLDVVKHVYFFVMWILKKIPFFGIT